MVLAPKLTQEERRRHERLIMQYFLDVIGHSSLAIEYHNNGNEKGIYKVSAGDMKVIAAAASKKAADHLLEEYNVLLQLYKGAPELFPRPITHYRSPKEDLGDLITMELLPHVDVDDFKRNNVGFPDFNRTLAYELGKAVATANHKTGRYMSDPHDGNIMVRVTDEKGLEVKFCDAIQWRTGSLEEGIRVLLINPHERPESHRFIKELRNGLIDSMVSYQGIDADTAKKRLEFMREYNDIF